MWFFRIAVACGLRFKSALVWVAARLKEPSSWASVAALLTFFGFNVGPETCQDVVGFCVDKETWQAIIGLGVGISGLLAVSLKEKADVRDFRSTADNVSTAQPVHNNSDLERVSQPFPVQRD